MLYNATLMYKTKNMQTKEHIMDESTSSTKFKIIAVLKGYCIASIQYPIHYLRKK